MHLSKQRPLFLVSIKTTNFQFFFRKENILIPEKANKMGSQGKVQS